MINKKRAVAITALFLLLQIFYIIIVKGKIYLHHLSDLNFFYAGVDIFWKIYYNRRYNYKKNKEDKQMINPKAYYVEMLSILEIKESALTNEIYKNWYKKGKSLVELNLALITCCL